MKNKIFFFLLPILIFSCSFDNKTGIWSGDQNERKRITELKKEQIRREKNTIKIFSSENIYSKEVSLDKKIVLSKPKKNSSWKMSNLNYQNFLGNIYLSGIENRFLKKKIGKNKFSISKITNKPLIFKENIFLSDDKGTIFKITENGDLIWKKNIYKKIYKKIYKNLTFSIYKNIIYVADNIGFVYAIDFTNGEVVWIKNHGIPLKSKIKIFGDKIFLINQDNRLLAFNTKDGSMFWNVRSVKSFIKIQNFLSLALSNQGDLIALDTSGNLTKIDSTNGQVYWSLNTTGSTLAHAADFFKSSNVVISNSSIIFSTYNSIFSYNLNNGYTNWRVEVSSIGTPIVDKNYIFLVTENGYFVILEKNTGEIVSSTYIFKILKKRKRSTKVTGFVMGSGKIYAVTLNGNLIISSATTGKVEGFRKIGNPVTASPIINDGKLFIYTENSKILGFN